MNNYVQLESTMHSIRESDQRAQDLKMQLSQKQKEVNDMLSEFKKMHSDLSQIKSTMQENKSHQVEELKHMKENQAETNLSHVFEKESEEARAKISTQVVRANLTQNLKRTK